MLRKEMEGGTSIPDEEWRKKNVVLVVCGGSGVTLKMLEKWRETYEQQSNIELGEW
jgi:L-serine/L-threonine ammonia-lyase